MQKNKREVLEEMYQALLEEKKGFDEKINKNLNRIAEIDAYLKSIYDKENSDFKVFSPRNVENVYKEQIEVSKQEKYAIENENQYQYRQVNKITKYLESIASVIDIEDDSNSIEPVELPNIDFEKNINILDIQEEERQRIARELHDSSLQNLTHLVHKVELSSMFIDQDPIRAKLELATITKNLKLVIDEIRNTIFNLRPMSFDDLGFKETVERLLNNLSESTDINITYEIDEVKSNNSISLMILYRIIQESCSNAIKHSSCSELKITLVNKKDEVQVTIADNGIGFDMDEMIRTKENHFGLKIMKERISLLGGTLICDSKPARGTTISIRVPNI